MVVDPCTSAPGKLRKGDHKFQASLGYKVRACLRHKKKGDEARSGESEELGAEVILSTQQAFRWDELQGH